jgi:hypothetical protein
MKRSIVAVLASLMWVLGAPAGAAVDGTQIGAGDTVYAGGGTPLSNGIFFPGTAQCTKDGCEAIGPIPQIERGTDLKFVNLDTSEVANTHSIVSIKRNKNGRPLFGSRDSRGPSQSSVVTSHLKRGEYPYFCRTHFGMYGIFEVIKPQ